MGGLVNRVAAWAFVLFAAVALIGPVGAQPAPAPASRIALVIGNGAYPSGPQASAANDAGLVAQTLTAAGFDVTGVRDLDGEGIRRAFRDFLARAAAAGPDGIAFVYLAGYAVQADGDNYLVPVDATLERETDLPIQAVRVSDLTRALAGVPLLGRVVVIDGAYKPPFPVAATLAGGLTLVEPEPDTLVAFNAAPGTLGPTAAEPYGVYAQAMAEMLRQPGVPVTEVFERIRLRVNETTRGADVPWSATRLSRSFTFLEPSADAPPPAATQPSDRAAEQRPIREFSAEDAYNVAVARDTFQGYQDYVGAFPDSPFAPRVRTLIAARREALTWRKTVSVGGSPAYWSYLRRYPKGPHAGDARRRLQALAVALAPPSDFEPIPYDVPPPPEAEDRFVDAPVIVFDDRDRLPPPPPPIFLLPPPPEDVYRLPPPPPPISAGFLPIPIPIPIPYGRPPGRPGRLQPLQGYSGSYDEPQPFMQDPQGRLVPRRGPDGGPRRPNRDQPGPGIPGGGPPPMGQANTPLPLPSVDPRQQREQLRQQREQQQLQERQQQIQQRDQRQQAEQIRREQQRQQRDQLRQQNEQQREQERQTLIQQRDQRRQDEQTRREQLRLQREQLKGQREQDRGKNDQPGQPPNPQRDQQRQEEQTRREQQRQQQEQLKQQRDGQRQQQEQQRQEEQTRREQQRQQQEQLKQQRDGQRQQQEQQRQEEQTRREQQRQQQEQLKQQRDGQRQQQEQQRQEEQTRREQQRQQQEQLKQQRDSQRQQQDQLRQQREQQRQQQDQIRQQRDGQRQQQEQQRQQQDQVRQQREQQQQQRQQQDQGRQQREQHRNECGNAGQPPCR